LKKRRVVNGKELVFRKPGEESDEETMKKSQVRNLDELPPRTGTCVAA
jgi:hypothetical protein